MTTWKKQKELMEGMINLDPEAMRLVEIVIEGFKAEREGTLTPRKKEIFRAVKELIELEHELYCENPEPERAEALKTRIGDIEKRFAGEIH